MPRLSRLHQNSIATLIRDYNSLPGYLKWFFPAELEIALHAHQATTHEVNSAWNIGNIFINHTWFFQRWFLSCLDTFAQSALVRRCALSLRAGETEAHHPAFDVAVTPAEGPGPLTTYFENAIMRQNLRDPVAQGYYHTAGNYANVDSIHAGLYELNGAGLLVGDAGKANFETLLVEGQFTPMTVATCLVALNEAGLLSGENAQTNRDLIKRRSSLSLEYLGSVINALRELKYAGLFSGETPQSKAIAQANFNAVLQHDEAPLAVARSLIQLSDAGLLTQNEGQEIRDIVSSHQDPTVAAHTILALQESDSTTGPSKLRIYTQRKVPTLFPLPTAREESGLKYEQGERNTSSIATPQL
ncbi:hypothetical protein [Legionella maioricensis]|uniref:Uncharacterized protein n=1 Tax=Legionella maioricensis TaxID=2896528 RepID=A0A9X2CYA7_9GAMM|nr:hypothetical protein [Legionella maioricensis]MCL9682934.1 hypothetical protein [Legionella maioricensis]MCL9689123.1 hypothetical protein [Legionella maioricensis]